jgi:hypothetical protein
MEHRPLGRTGVSVSTLCLGTMMFGEWSTKDHDESIRIIHRARGPSTALRGEQHWHGAAPDTFMEHLAMLDNADDPATARPGSSTSSTTTTTPRAGRR